MNPLCSVWEALILTFEFLLKVYRSVCEVQMGASENWAFPQNSNLNRENYDNPLALGDPYFQTNPNDSGIGGRSCSNVVPLIGASVQVRVLINQLHLLSIS